MSQVEFNDPHVMAAWVAVQMNRPGEMKTILVVETSLNLNQEDKAYDSDSIKSLAHKVWAYLAAHDYIESAELVPIKIA
jgi:hypothetical protein